MKFTEKIKNLIKIYITFSKGEREISETREIGALENREMGDQNPSFPPFSKGRNKEENQKALADSQDSLTRRPAESNRFPYAGNVRVSIDGQNRLAAASSRLCSNILTNQENKNNRFVSEVAVSGSLEGNTVPPIDTRYSQYSTPENLVKGYSTAEVAASVKPQSQGDQLSTTGNVGSGAENPPQPSFKKEGKEETSASKIKISCPYCSSGEFVKRGTRQKKREKVQLYICKQCGRTFTPFSLKGKHYPLITILDAISYYNLGFSLDQVSTIMKEKQKIEIQPSTIATWYEEHKELCAYHRMRPFAVKEFSPYDVVETATLAHRQLYRFRYHRAKTKYIMEEDFKHYKFYPLKEFLELVPGECPHQYFQEGLRASEAPIKFSKVEMIVRAKENFATRLAALVLQGVKENKQRHEILQKFMLANDSVTVATEVPVYIRKEDLEHMQTQLGFEMYHLINPPQPSFKKEGEETNSSLSKGRLGGILKNKKLRKDIDENYQTLDPDEIPKLITGHIDFLQIRNGSIHILDYKDNAAKERPIEQLTLYALALSRLTGIRVFHFKCAWFDEKDYFEFFPLHVVYKPRRGRRKIYTKEGVYNLNEKISKIENLRPIA